MNVDRSDGYFARGRQVSISNLKGRPELNTQVGRLVRYETTSGRWHLLLESGGTVRILAANLQNVPAQNLLASMGQKLTSASSLDKAKAKSIASCEKSWFYGWQKRHEAPPSLEKDYELGLGDGPVVQMLVLALQHSAVGPGARSLARLSLASRHWGRFVLSSVAPRACLICHLPAGLPLASFNLWESSQIYENFDDDAESCWKRWEAFGQLEEDEPLRIPGAGRMHMQLTRPHPETLDHFGRGVQRWFDPWRPSCISLRLCIETAFGNIFHGGAVGYVILGDSTPPMQCGSRFGNEVIFMYAAAQEESLSLSWCVGRSSGLDLRFDTSRYGCWLRIEIGIDWNARRLSVSLDGEHVGETSFRSAKCCQVEHITLVNLGGPAIAKWSEISLA